MSEGIIIALITALGSLLGGVIGQLIAASATIKAATIKEKTSQPSSTERRISNSWGGVIGGAIIGAIATLVVLLFLGSFPSPKNTPQVISPSNSPTTNSQTETFTKSTISYGRLLFEENFDTPPDSWDLGGNRLDSGNLIMSPNNDLVPFGFGNSEPPVYSDFIFEVQFSFPKDSNGIEFMVRSQYPPCAGWNCSIVVVTDRPYNNIVAYRWENGEHGDSIAINYSITPSKINLLPDQWNRITIIANGIQYKVYINDYFIMTFTDSKYTEGTFMLNNPGPSEVKIDYIRFYDLP